MKVTVSRTAHFNAAHRLHNPNLSDELNKKIFGKCNNPYYHGHNYNLTVKVTGEIDEVTGYVIDMKILRDIIQKHVLDKFDHKNLNEEVEEFSSLNPTAENICVVIWQLLRNQLEEKFDLKVILYETERNFVEYPSI
ncbi:6-carboxytetrahydropterin synthase [Flammeovirga yaeyamensis]|uniref:6-carboxy-5,6,7,8-tetrahydropterin synthase n=1 Tax=Flammeovirga yaeyamensis TaxID=367791 RepID=A0AAX1N129_9BACT|nr:MULTISPECIES: 6-carboxytetrahydropterin synthase [Flammeovirga]ANQ51288.1 6-carboxytetrahydropterin synthase [Flammeovirga sp. MY04]MBB3698342.1 6-pyruvoyltetrahydropterin/6-carboxytetrahydropterin synthase [Flammeovirga yaeyamensis]NMF34305.1 6-carboxytetrahydropterin synthase [Flammeovirga yaeyamensis]QWG01288.1 6-carboxytetrahydropterin synthase [Flammeovirga yaeyamensis]